jgi:hypothetical protein
VRHVGHMAGIHFDRLGIGALRHHALLIRIDRPVCGRPPCTKWAWSSRGDS